MDEKRPYQNWTSQSALITRFVETGDSEAFKELVRRAEPGAEVTPEVEAAVAADEAARPAAAQD